MNIRLVNRDCALKARRVVSGDPSQASPAIYIPVGLCATQFEPCYVSEPLSPTQASRQSSMAFESAGASNQQEDAHKHVPLPGQLESSTSIKPTNVTRSQYKQSSVQSQAGNAQGMLTSILNEVVCEEAKRIVSAILQEQVNRFLAEARREKSSVHRYCETFLDEFLREEALPEIVREVTSSLVQRYMLSRKATRIFDELIDEELHCLAQETISRHQRAATRTEKPHSSESVSTMPALVSPNLCSAVKTSTVPIDCNSSRNRFGTSSLDMLLSEGGFVDQIATEHLIEKLLRQIPECDLGAPNPSDINPSDPDSMQDFILPWVLDVAAAEVLRLHFAAED